jgi:hypothetical protein
MAAQKKKTTDEQAAERCGMTVEQWQHVKQQAAGDRSRGRRPAGTAGADTKLAGWGAVDDQMPLFADSEYELA